jgi:hypothetical protein
MRPRSAAPSRWVDRRHRTCVRYAGPVGTWHDLDVGREIEAPLQRCAELLGVDLATIRELAANVEPYLRADGTRIWSLMQLERPAPARGLPPTPGRLPRPPIDPSHRRIGTATVRRVARSFERERAHPYQGSALALVSAGLHQRAARTMYRWRPLRTPRVRWHVDQMWTKAWVVRRNSRSADLLGEADLRACGVAAGARTAAAGGRPQGRP